MVLNLSHLRFISPLQLYSSLVSTARADGETREAGQVSSFACYRGWTKRNTSPTVYSKGSDAGETRTAQRNVGRNGGTERKQKASPLSTYHGGQVKKSIASTFLCSFVPASSQPTLRLFGWAKETVTARREFVRGNLFSLEIVFKPGDRINS